MLKAFTGLPLFAVLLVLAPASGQTQEAIAKPPGNFIEMIAQPPAKQNPVVKTVVATLSAGKVKTVSDARSWAFTPRDGLLRGDEGSYVTGLFYVEKFESGDQTRELVWEVRVVAGGYETRRLLLISVLTGQVTQIYPRY